MASFGAKYPYFCPVAEEAEGALPIYKGEPVRIDRLVKADLTVNLASGKLFADDALAESVDEFTSGSIAMETDDLEDETAAVLYGATATDGAVRYNVGDDPPAGGLAYFKKLMQRKKVLYKGYFYPLVKAAPGDDAAQMKTDSITFGTSSTTFSVFACETGDWQITKEIETEAEAIEWIKAQFVQTAIRAKARKRAIIPGITKIKKPKNETGKRTIPPTISQLPADTRRVADRNITDFCRGRSRRITAGRNPVAAVWAGRR